MKILALDTSGLVASVALVEDDLVTARFSIQYKTTHSQIMMPMLEKIRDLIQLDLHTLDAIAICKGPGSFTGLRIGCATATGLSLSLGVPLIPIPTVDGIAYELCGQDALVCPMMDARRSQVYTGVYTFEAEACMSAAEDEASGADRAQGCAHGFVMRTLLPQCAISIEELAEHLNRLAAETGKRILLTGDGVPVYRAQMEALLSHPWSEAPAHLARQDAAALGMLAEQYLREGKTETPETFKPEYLRSAPEPVSALPGGKGRVSQVTAAARDRVYVKPLDAEHLEEAAALDHANMGAEAWTRQQLEDALHREDTIYLYAEKAGRVVGLIGLQNIAGEGEISNVSVAEDARGEGIGGKMMAQILQRAKGKGVKDFTLEVRAGNKPAIALYEKFGFRSEGIRPGFYDNPREDAVIYWKRVVTND